MEDLHIIFLTSNPNEGGKVSTNVPAWGTKIRIRKAVTKG